MSRIRVWWAFRRWARASSPRMWEGKHEWLKRSRHTTDALLAAMRNAGLCEYQCRYGVARIGPGSEWFVTSSRAVPR